MAIPICLISSVEFTSNPILQHHYIIHDNPWNETLAKCLEKIFQTRNNHQNGIKVRKRMLFYHYHHSSDEAKKMLYDLYYEKGMANE